MVAGVIGSWYIMSLPYFGFVLLKGGIGPVLISSASSCYYDVEWKTDYACADNTKVTQNCTYSDGRVTFDLSKLEKRSKIQSYGVKDGDYVYRIKVCSNGQDCGRLIFWFKLSSCTIT